MEALESSLRHGPDVVVKNCRTAPKNMAISRRDLGRSTHRNEQNRLPGRSALHFEPPTISQSGSCFLVPGELLGSLGSRAGK